MRWTITDVHREPGGAWRARVEQVSEARALGARLIGRRARPEVRHYVSADGAHWEELVSGAAPPYLMTLALRHRARQNSWRDRLQALVKRKGE